MSFVNRCRIVSLCARAAKYRRSIRAGIFSFAMAAASYAIPAHAALINPLAYTSLGSFDVGIGNTVTIDTTLNQIRVNGILAFTGVVSNQDGAANAAAGIPELAVFSFDDINIGPGVAISVTGNRGLALLSRDAVTLRSPLSVNGGDFAAASPAGGFAGGGPGNNGAGPGAGHASTIGDFAGAGGGGFGGNGGQGGGYGASDSLGGSVYPASNSLAGPLYGGSGGGSGQNGGSYGPGGGGGGALEISALGQVNLFSSVTSLGGAAAVADNSYGGGGGGSGGSIRIAGQKVNLGSTATVSANGSSGGFATGGGGFSAGGGGGGGRVLIQQNANPLASGISADGGAAIGAAQPGTNGTVEQVASGLNVNTAALNVRLGTGSATGYASLARGGDSNGNIYGLIDHVGTGFSGATEGTTFSFAGPFSGGVTQLVPLTYATTSRTTDSITVHSNGGDATLAVGRGVGPTLATNMGTHPNTTINIGTVDIYHSAAFQLILSNTSADLGIDSPLTSLGFLGISIGGPDAAAFSVDNLIPTTLFEQQYANLPIHFNPTFARSYSATLTIQTDQGAANGAIGQAFTFNLAGGGLAAVPEPLTAQLTLLAGVMVFAIRRRS